MRKPFFRAFIALLLVPSRIDAAMADGAPFVVERNGRSIAIEPYAPNILRVTLSVDRAAATASAGYGFESKPSTQGGTRTHDEAGGEVFRSSRMVVRLAPERPAESGLSLSLPLDALNYQLREKYFG